MSFYQADCVERAGDLAGGCQAARFENATLQISEADLFSAPLRKSRLGCRRLGAVDARRGGARRGLAECSHRR
jgi:hypothetical protein